MTTATTLGCGSRCFSKREQQPNSRGHRRDFLDCVKTRAQTITPIDVGHRSVTVAHLGNIAMLLGRAIHWDPKREQIINDPTASCILGRAMRSPWYV